MPVDVAFDTEHRIVCAVYSGALDKRSLLESLADFVQTHKNAGDISFLNVYRETTDLSQMSANDVFALKDNVHELLVSHGLVRLKSAHVLDGSVDAKLILPLWAGANAADPETAVPIAMFDDLDEAFRFLGLDPRAGLALVHRAEQGEG